MNQKNHELWHQGSKNLQMRSLNDQKQKAKIISFWFRFLLAQKYLHRGLCCSSQPPNNYGGGGGGGEESLSEGCRLQHAKLHFIVV